MRNPPATRRFPAERRRRCPGPGGRPGAPAAPPRAPSDERCEHRAAGRRRSVSSRRGGRQLGHGVGQSGPTAVQPPLWPWPRRRIHVASDCATRHPVGGPECAGGPAMMSHSIRCHCSSPSQWYALALEMKRHRGPSGGRATARSPFPVTVTTTWSTPSSIGRRPQRPESFSKHDRRAVRRSVDACCITSRQCSTSSTDARQHRRPGVLWHDRRSRPVMIHDDSSGSRSISSPAARHRFLFDHMPAQGRCASAHGLTRGNRRSYSGECTSGR